MNNPGNPFLEMFNDRERVSHYAEGPPRFTPGFFDVHRMVNVLLQERVGGSAKILVHGCGGGLELQSLAHENPGWQFLGVDPAGPMLDVVRERLGSMMDRVELCHGYIDDAPAGPFDAATSLLTLHFLDASERTDAVLGIAQRLKSGAPLVIVHSSFPQTEPERSAWLSRYSAFAVASGADAETAEMARAAVAASPTNLEPGEDLQVLRDAGLVDITSFYHAFTWRGWVGYAP
jgi:tRNA (cmo5U34)-methyltransferase